MDRRRDDAAVERQRQRRRFDGAGRRQTMPHHRLDRGHRNPARALAEHLTQAARLRLIVLRRRRAVRVDVIHRVGVDPRGAQGVGDQRGDRAPFRLGRGRMVRFAADAVAENLGVNPRAAALGARVLLEHEDGGGFADVHALPRAAERPARFAVDQPQGVESAERQPAQDVAGAGQRGIDAAPGDGIRRIADRHRARRTGGQHRRFRALETEVRGEDVARRAREVVEDLRRRRAAQADALRLGEPFLVAHQIGGAGAEHHAGPREVDAAVEQSGIGERLARRDDRGLIGARQPAPGCAATPRGSRGYGRISAAFALR